MSPVCTASDNARDPLEGISTLDPRLPHAMQCADLHLLNAVRCDIVQRWNDGGIANGTDRRP